MTPNYIYCHISGHIKKRNAEVSISSGTQNFKKMSDMRVNGSLQKKRKKRQINTHASRNRHIWGYCKQQRLPIMMPCFQILPPVALLPLAVVMPPVAIVVPPVALLPLAVTVPPIGVVVPPDTLLPLAVIVPPIAIVVLPVAVVVPPVALLPLAVAVPPLAIVLPPVAVIVPPVALLPLAGSRG
jgi:hypothetical protein